MDSKLKAIFKALQNGIKLEATPFQRIALEIGIDESEVISLIKANCDNGTIRRLGAAVRPDKLDYTNNALVSWKVSEDKVASTGEKMSQYEEVTHCYERGCPEGWDYNFFSMIHAKSEQELQDVVKAISCECQISEYEIFRTVKELKKTSMKYFD